MNDAMNDATIDDIIKSVTNPTLEINVEVRQRSARTMREYSKTTRIYIFIEGETLLQNLANRRSRPHRMYRERVLPTVFEKLGWDAKTKVRWSQQAGCPCGCSPGFIVTGMRWHPPQDIHVTVAEK